MNLKEKYKKQLETIIIQSGNGGLNPIERNTIRIDYFNTYIEEPINLTSIQSFCPGFLCCWLLARNIKIPRHIHNYIMVSKQPNLNFWWKKYIERSMNKSL